VRGAYTPLYASPQQMRGEPADPRDDVHALGVIWFQVLTGDLGAGPAADWRDELGGMRLPEGQLQLLAGCLASRPERRPADAAALTRQLDDLLRAGLPPSPPPVTPVAPAKGAKPGAKRPETRPVPSPEQGAGMRVFRSAWLRSVRYRKFRGKN